MTPRLSLLLVALIIPSVAGAQERPCFESQDYPLWNAVAVEAEAGASRPASGGLELELCSQSLGTAELSDSYQGLMRGVMGDYSLTATLVDLDPDSSAGLLLSADTRRADSAHFFILAERVGAGPSVLVRSGFRPAQGAASTSVDAVSIEATLPITLRLTRDHGVLLTSIVDANGETFQLAVPIADSALSTWGQLGLVQAGSSYVAEARARFGTPKLVFAFVPPAEVECLGETTMPQSGGTLTLNGRGFDRVLGVSLGSTDLSVVRATDEALTVELPPASAAGFGKLTFDLGDVDQVTQRTIATGGSPFVRGDLTGDSLVDSKDLKALRLAIRNGILPECRATADVNGDGLVNSLDDTQLASFLAGRRGAKPPAAPFPAPGIIPGLPACGLPAGPVVERLVNADGTAIAGPLAEGSLVRLEGSNLPLHPILRFGNVVAQVQPGATAERLVAMIGVVPSAGPRCLVIQSGAAAVKAGQTSFGLAYGDLVSERPDLCPELVASRLVFAADAVAGTDGALFLPIDPAAWNPDLALRVNVSLAFPLVERTSRGPRSASFAFKHNPPLEDGTAPVTYSSWLAVLAARTAKAIGAEDDCDCEAEVLPAPQDGGLWIKPCFLTTPVPPPPPLPPGSVPGGLSLKAARPSLGAANAFALPPEPTCEDLAGAGNARQIAWCHLAQITAIRTEPSDPNNANDHPSYLGLPKWEGYRPMHTLDTLDDNPWIIDPRDQEPELKETLVEPVLADHMWDRDYFDACGIAARAAYCIKGASETWMPILPVGTRIVKAFWKTLSELPLSAKASDYYSYDPPGFYRRYLVGMHVSVATGQGFGGPEYLSWATFWVPKPPGETLNKGGGLLSDDYNDNCFVGGPENRPEELSGTPWGNFSMCVQGYAGEHCGNPWGPKDECRPNPEPYVDAGEGCAGCHAQRTQINWGEDARDPQDPVMRMGWMAIPANVAGAAQTCMSEIVAGKKKGQTPHLDNAYCENF